MQQAAPKKKKVRVPRVVNGVETMVEIEVDDVGGPTWGPNDKHALLNHHLRRVDGPIKVSGLAEYTYDKQLSGMLHGRVLRSPHAHARVIKVDTGAAERIPGVKVVLSVTNKREQGAPVASSDGRPGEAFDTVVHFAGEPVAAVAADTPEIAEDAIRAIKVEYQVLPHVVRAEDALKETAP